MDIQDTPITTPYTPSKESEDKFSTFGNTTLGSESTMNQDRDYNEEYRRLVETAYNNSKLLGKAFDASDRPINWSLKDLDEAPLSVKMFGNMEDGRQLSKTDEEDIKDKSYSDLRRHDFLTTMYEPYQDENGDLLLKEKKGNMRDMELKHQVIDAYGPQSNSEAPLKAFGRELLYNNLQTPALEDIALQPLRWANDTKKAIYNKIVTGNYDSGEKDALDLLADDVSDTKKINSIGGAKETENNQWSTLAGIASSTGQGISSMITYSIAGTPLAAFGKSIGIGAKLAEGAGMWGAGIGINGGETYYNAKNAGLDDANASFMALATGIVKTAIETEFPGSKQIHQVLVGHEFNMTLSKEIMASLDKDATKLTEQELKTKLTPILHKFTQFVKKMIDSHPIVSGVVGEGTEEFLQNYTDRSAEYLYDHFVAKGNIPRHDKFAYEHFTKAEFINACSDWLGGAVLGGFGGAAVSLSGRSNEREKGIVSQILKGNTDKVLNTIDDLVESGHISEEEANLQKDRVNQINSLWNDNQDGFKNLSGEDAHAIKLMAMGHINDAFNLKKQINTLVQNTPIPPDEASVPEKTRIATEHNDKIAALNKILSGINDKITNLMPDEHGFIPYSSHQLINNALIQRVSKIIGNTGEYNGEGNKLSEKYKKETLDLLNRDLKIAKYDGDIERVSVIQSKIDNINNEFISHINSEIDTHQKNYDENKDNKSLSQVEKLTKIKKAVENNSSLNDVTQFINAAKKNIQKHDNYKPGFEEINNTKGSNKEDNLKVKKDKAAEIASKLFSDEGLKNGFENFKKDKEEYIKRRLDEIKTDLSTKTFEDLEKLKEESVTYNNWPKALELYNKKIEELSLQKDLESKKAKVKEEIVKKKETKPVVKEEVTTTETDKTDPVERAEENNTPSDIGDEENSNIGDDKEDEEISELDDDLFHKLTAITNIAYLSGEYSEDENGRVAGNIFNEDGTPKEHKGLDKRLLSNNLFQEGTELTISIDTTYPNFTELSKSADTIPIAIYKKGENKPIGYVHIMSYINSTRVAYGKEGIIREAVRKETQDLRDYIFANRTSVNSVITSKSYGYLSLLNRNVTNSLTDAFGEISRVDSNLQEVILSNNVYLGIGENDIDVFGNPGLDLVNKKIKKGVVYAMLPTSVKNKYFAKDLKLSKLKEGDIDVILHAIDSYLSGKDLKLGIHNIKTVNGLRNFISELVYTGGNDKSETRKSSFINLISDKDGNLVINWGINSSFFEKDKSKHWDMAKEQLKEFLSNKYYNVSRTRLTSEKFNHYRLEDGEIVANPVTSYAQFLINNNILSTNIHPIIGEKGERYYFTQPNIGFDTNTDNKPSNLKVNNNDISIHNEDTPFSEEELNPEEETTDLTKEEEDTLGDMFVKPDDKNKETDITYNPDIHFYKHNSFSLEQQNHIVNSLTALFLKSFPNGGEATKVEAKLNSYLNKISENGTELQKAIVEKIKKDWKESVEFVGFANLLQNNLKKLSLTLDEDDIVEDDVIELNNWSEGAQFKYSAKDNAPAILKRFLSFVPITDNNGNKKSSILGLEIYNDYSVLYDNALAFAADRPLHTILESIKLLSDMNPQFKEVYSRLMKSSQDIKNAFTSSMRLRYNPYLSGRYTQNENGLKFEILSSNANETAKVIINEWNEGLKNSDLVTEVTDGENIGHLKIDTEKGKILLDKFNILKEKVNLDSADIIELSGLLNQIGINITPNELNNFNTIENGLLNKIVKKNLGYLFEKLAAKDESAQEILFDLNNPFKDESRTSGQLASVISKIRTDTATKTLMDGANNKIYAYNKPTFMSDKIMRLFGDSVYLDRLLATDFASTSDWGKIMKRPKSKFRDIFRVSTYDSSKNKSDKGDATFYADMSPKEIEMLRLNFFLNQGSKDLQPSVMNNGQTGNRIVHLFDLTYSDKDMQQIITTLAYDVDYTIDANGEFVLGDEIMSKLYTLAEGELYRIRSVIKQNNLLNNSEKLKHYHDSDKSLNGGLKFFLFPKLNENKRFYNEKGEPNPLVFSEKSDIDQEDTDEIYKEIREEVKRWIDYRLQNWAELGISVKNNLISTHLLDESYIKIQKDSMYNKSTGGQLLHTALDYTINWAMAMGNMIQLVHGDIAFTTKNEKGNSDIIEPTYINYFKRLAAEIAPRVSMFKDTDTVDTLFISDIQQTKELKLLLTHLKGVINDDLLKQYYDNFDITDAQEVTTLAEHLLIMYDRGLIDTDIYNSILSKIKKEGYTLDDEELKVVFQPMKPVHVVSEPNSELKAAPKYYIKTSSYPLLLQLTKGTNLDKLRLTMEKNGVSRAVFASGVKTGLHNIISLYDGKGDFLDNIDELVSNNKITLRRDGFGIQQENPIHEDKLIIEGTQQRKNLFTNLVHSDEFIHDGVATSVGTLQDNFDELHKDLLNQKWDTLTDRFTTTDDSIDYKKFQKLLIESATSTKGSNSWNPNDLAMLALNDDETNFKTPLFYLNGYEKIGSLLTSIFTNNVFKSKLNGNSYIQASSGLYEKGKNFFKDSALKYMIKDTDGSYYSEIHQAWNYRDKDGNIIDSTPFLNNDGTPNENFPKELLYIIGYRIPNSGHSSMARLKITKFLSSNLGDLMIVPPQITKQMGSDFDVDKMYTYNYAYNASDNKKLDKDSKEYIDNIVKQKLIAKGIEAVDNIYPKEKWHKIKKQTIEENKNSEFVKYKTNPSLNIDDSGLNNTMNKILDINHTIIGCNLVLPEGTTNNHMIEKIMEPIGFDSFKDESDNLRKYDKDNEKLSILFDKMSNDFYESNKSGKIGTATSSIALTNNALAQQAGLNINNKVVILEDGTMKSSEEIAILFTNDDGTLMNDDIAGNSVKDHQYSIYHNKAGAWRLDKIRGFSDKLISSILSELQNMSVDNAKAQLLGRLNINRHTANVTYLLARLGFDEKIISPFMKQESLIEYSKLMETLSDTTVSYDERKSKKEILVNLQNKYEKLAYTKIERINGISRKIMLQALEHKHSLTGESNGLSTEKFEAARKYYYKIQAQVLYNFLQYNEISAQISNLQSVINPETNGLGKSPLLSLFKEEQYRLMITQKSSFLGNKENFFTKVNGERTYIGNIIDKLIDANKILSGEKDVNGNYIAGFFPYNSTSYSNMRRALLEEMGINLFSTSETKSIKTLEKIEREIRSALYTNPGLVTDGDINEVRNALIKSKKYYDKNTKKMVYIHKSLAKRLSEYTGNNRFIKKLIWNLAYKSTDFDTIKYPATYIEDNTDSFNMSLSWQEALESNDEVEKTLAEDLIKYAYLTGGVIGKSSFIKYVPVNYINKTFQAKNKGFVNFNEPYVLDSIYTQYFQHKFKEVTQLSKDLHEIANMEFKPSDIEDYKYLHRVENPKKESLYESGYFPTSFILKDNEDVDIIPLLVSKSGEKTNPDFLTLRNPENKQTVLYLKSNGVYSQINTLGQYNIKQYQLNAPELNVSPTNLHPEHKIVINSETLNTTHETDERKEFSDKYNLESKDIHSILSGVAENAEFPEYAHIANLLSSKLTDVSYETSLEDSKYYGEYDPKNNTITSFLNKIGWRDDYFQRNVLHESTHALTRALVDEYMNHLKNGLYTGNELNETQIQAIKSLEALRNFLLNSDKIDTNLKDIIRNNGTFGVNELIAFGLTNRNFQIALNNIHFSEKTTIFKRFIDLVSRLVGIKITDGSSLQEAMNHILSLVDSENTSNTQTQTNNSEDNTNTTQINISKELNIFINYLNMNITEDKEDEIINKLSDNDFNILSKALNINIKNIRETLSDKLNDESLNELLYYINNNINIHKKTNELLLKDNEYKNIIRTKPKSEKEAIELNKEISEVQYKIYKNLIKENNTTQTTINKTNNSDNTKSFENNIDNNLGMTVGEFMKNELNAKEREIFRNLQSQNLLFAKCK